MYEYVTEGGISRFSAFFFGAPPVAVGPVRSARIATVQLTQLYGATLLFSGAGNYVLGLLGSTGVRHYDEDSAAGDLFRVSFRFAPHNLFTDGAHIADLLRRTAAPAVGYRLWTRGAPAPAGGRPATAGITVPISAFEQPVYSWRPDLGGYVRTESTGLMTDADTGRPLVIPTVVVMQVDVAPAPQVHDVNGAIGTYHNLSGSGGAQFFVGGREYDGGWSQPPQGGPPVFQVTGGAPAPIATGPVWIELVPRNNLASYH